MEDNQCIISVESEATALSIFSPATGKSIIYSEPINIFLANWMLYIPALELNLGEGVLETYWLLLDYAWPEGYFTVDDYGLLTGPITGEGASLVLEDATWRIYIPECEVEWDPDRPYWLTLELVFTDTDITML